MTSSNDIRAAFVDFFAANKHEVVPSGPLVPPNDPTLLFTNAGMVQFKNVFTGVETRPYSRAVSVQKCVRAGGKHNDLDNVGYTRRHHTFFEMLGSFSFGDYFKELAIELAWRLITKEFKVDPGRLIVTVFKDDDEAYNAWKKVAKLPDDRLLRIDSADNFWSMGEIGPCGPCTEIFYDHGPGLPGGPPGSGDEGDRFVEIWNLVFMQYEQTEDGKRVDLPRQSVDTGMGIERIAAVLQGVHDNYDTDILRALIRAVAELTGKAPDGEQKVSHRVIADHLRACAFLIADGVLPSNEGRGYVLRRIMRRAMRHVHMLGAKQPEMYRLVPVLVAQMGQAYPELMRAQPLITQTLRHEETRFRELLGRGLKLLEEEVKRLPSGKALAGEVAFKLYDTYGFPLDLTEDVLRGRGIAVDHAGFDAAMARQRAEARKSWAGSGDAAHERIWFEIRERTGATEFLGYAEDEAEGEVVALVKDGKEVDALEDGDEGAVVTNQTPFYGEAGGQVGDTGTLTGEHGAAFEVTDTKRHADDLFVHLGRMVKGTLKRGEIAEMKIDAGRRTKIRANHSATHLLHEALRRRLGEHVTQKGSLVAPDRLRFDFSHPQALTDDELADIENEVNARIRLNSDVVTKFMTPKEAVEDGALALFGEKYGEEVRVLSMGHREGGERFSTELCGGTHVRRTGDIGVFKIIGESAVGSGVRRIEALTGQAAIDYMEEQAEKLNKVAAELRVSPAEVPARVAALMDERKKLERELSETRKQLATGGGAAEPAFKDVGGVKFAGKLLGDVPAKELKPMADELKKKIGSGIIALASSSDGKASLVVAVTPDLTQRFDAVQLVRVGSETLGGKGGGGRPDMAQAGGPNVDALGQAVEAIEKAVSAGGAAAA